MTSTTSTPRSTRCVRWPIAASKVPSGERADVHLVHDAAEHAAAVAGAPPARVTPGVRGRVIRAARPVDAVRQPGTARVGTRIPAVETEGVVQRALVGARPRPPAAVLGGHGVTS